MTTPVLRDASDGRFHATDILICSILVVLVGIAFYPAMNAAFSPFDDDATIADNVHLRSFSPANVVWMLTDTSLTLRYAPLRWIPWALVYVIAGNGPRGYHILSYSLHLANTVVVYGCARFLFATFCRWTQRPAPRWAPWLVGLATAFWALHPLRVECIAWALAAQYTQAAAFAMLTLAFFFRARDQESRGVPARGSLALSAACYGISVLFYPAALCLPMLLPVVDVYLFRRHSQDRRESRRLIRAAASTWTFFLVAMLVGVMTVYGRMTSSSTFWGAPPSMADFGAARRIAQACFVLMYYVWKPFDPTHLSPIYAYAVNFSPAEPLFALSIVAFLGISAGAIAVRHRYPLLTILWVAHVTLVLPFGGYFDHPFIPGDRYSYLHDAVFVAALAGAMAWTLLRSSARIQGVLVGAMVSLAAVLGLLSSVQSRLWRSYDVLFQHVLEELGDNPYRAQIYWQWGKWCLRDHRFTDAVACTNQTLAMNSDNLYALQIKAAALDGVAHQHVAAGDAVGAQDFYAEAGGIADQLFMNTGDDRHLLAAATIYAHAGRLEDARARLAEALRRKPGDPEVRQDLERILAQIAATQNAR